MKTGPTTRDGVLLVDKPAGMTSHDVVSVARRALRERRIGHAGTLDPFATGLLVLMVGRATRLLPYVSGEPKVYDATIRFGARTDTDDLEGVVVEEAALPQPDLVEAATAALTGTIDQVPPAYSAKQVQGVRAYDAARRGRALALEPVTVTVHAWEIHERRGAELDVRITCSGGTYIRALARDLGARTGSAAHLSSLRRIRSGEFSVGSAVSLEPLRSGDAALLPPIAAVPELSRRTLAPDEEQRIARGQAIESGDAAGEHVALVDAGGDLVAIANAADGQLRPKVVLRAE